MGRDGGAGREGGGAGEWGRAGGGEGEGGREEREVHIRIVVLCRKQISRYMSNRTQPKRCVSVMQTTASE